MAEKLSDYLKTAEAAEFLGVSQNTLRTWAKQGKIEVDAPGPMMVAFLALRSGRG